jgi:hypothetical protein
MLYEVNIPETEIRTYIRKIGKMVKEIDWNTIPSDVLPVAFTESGIGSVLIIQDPIDFDYVLNKDVSEFYLVEAKELFSLTNKRFEKEYKEKKSKKER